MTPFYQKSGITLYLEDCIEGMTRETAPKTIDVVVTSPPYNIGIKYSYYRDSRPRADYLKWIGVVGEGVKRALSDDGSFFLNVGGIPRDPWLPFDIAQTLRSEFVLQNSFHWIKSIAIMKRDVGGHMGLQADIAPGHYKPIGGRRFVNDCQEYIFHFTKRGDVKLDRLAVGVPYQDKSNIGRWKAKHDVRCRGNTWFIPYQTIQDKRLERPHPSTFPVALPEMCMKIHGLDRIERAMDPFIGIGTTALACMNLKKQCIGFEVDRQYLQEASLRLNEAGRRRD